MTDQPPVPPTQPTPPVPPTPPAPPPGSATWQGVQPVVARPEDQLPPVPPGPPPAPPVGGPPGGGGGGNGKVIAVVLVVLAILGIGAFLLLSGGDDDDGEDVAIERERDEDEDEDDEENEETTTTEAEETTTSQAEEEPEETTTSAAGGEEPAGTITFAGITDNSGQLVVEVPDTWTQVDGSPLGDGAPNVQASTDLAAFRQLAASGISFTLLNQQNADPDTTLDFLTAGQVGSCEEQPRQDYDDTVFTGRLQELRNCGGQGVTLITIVASNAAGQSVEVSTVIVPPDPVEEIEQHIIETFNLNT